MHRQISPLSKSAAAKYSWVTIGLDNCLLPGGTKPLPEPELCFCQLGANLNLPKLNDYVALLIV